MKYTVKALMVEDLQISQLVARQLFARLNCHLDMVQLASRGIEKLSLSAYDIIFIDIQLPDINGLDFVSAVRQAESKGKRIPIIAITSTATEEVKVKAKEVGCDDFIKKPLTFDRLKEILLKYVSQKTI